MKKKVAALLLVGFLGVSGSAFADTYELPGVGSVTVEQTDNGANLNVSDASGAININLGFGTN